MPVTLSCQPDHPQRALMQLLVGTLNDAQVGHDTALGALLNVYRATALSYPCCFSESIAALTELLRELNSAHVLCQQQPQLVTTKH